MTDYPHYTLSRLEMLESLAMAAKPKSDEDWGSTRQLNTENDFFNMVREVLPEDDYSDLEDWCLKATTEEQIDEGFRRASDRLQQAAQFAG